MPEKRRVEGLVNKYFSLIEWLFEQKCSFTDERQIELRLDFDHMHAYVTDLLQDLYSAHQSDNYVEKSKI